MNSTDVRSAFLKLKPLCDKLVKSPQKNVLTTILSECEYLPDPVLQEIQTYILYPFIVHLKNTTPGPLGKDDMRLNLVRAMHRVFCRTHVGTVERFLKYFSVLIYQIFDKDSHEKVTPDLDEDLATSVVKAITEMTLRLPRNILDELYTRSNAPQLGQGIYLCVQIAKTQQYKTLRINALQCILALSTVHANQMEELHGGELNRELCNQVADVLMFFLPGLMGALQEIATGEVKQGSFLTCLAIGSIGDILCLVMMDQNPGEVVPIVDDDFKKVVTSHKSICDDSASGSTDPFGKKLRSRGSEGMLEHLEKAERDETWTQAAGEKLSILMASLVPLRYHPQSSVRMELALICANIIRYCSRNMRPSLKYILDILIVLSEEGDLEIVEICREALDRFCHESEDDARYLADVVEDGFCLLLKKPHAYLSNFDVSQQISELNLLKGYMRLLCSENCVPQKLTQILSSSAMLNRFTVVLLDIFKMECSHIKLTEDLAIRDMESNVSNICPWRIFTFLEDPRSLSAALQICDILGACEAVYLIVDYLLDNFKRQDENKKEIIFLLNQITTGFIDSTGMQEASKSAENLIKNIAATYMEPENWYLPIKVCRDDRPPGQDETLDVTVYNPRQWAKERTPGLFEGGLDVRYTDISYGDLVRTVHRDDSCITISEAQNNIVKICLMTEGIGQMALVLQNDVVIAQQYLQKSLYLILERAGSGNEAIHLSGMRALGHLTDACHHGNITDLIKENADYFTHEANMKLKKINDNVEVLDVLLVVMKYSNAPLLPCLYEIVSNVLNQCSQRNGNQNISLFLRLFYTFIKFVKSKYRAKKAQPFKIITSPYDDSAAIIPILMEFKINKYPDFKNRLQFLKRIEKIYTNDPTDSDDAADQLLGELQNPEVRIAMIVSVLKNTLNFIPSKDRSQRLWALDVFREGVTAIKDHENDLLPLVHAVWAPLVNRMRETAEPLVIIRAFLLLTTLAEVSKDFIRARTQSDVMPLICDYLTKTSKENEIKREGSGYAFTQRYKLQLCFLQGLGDLCVSLAVQEKEMYQILVATQAYLSCKQPKPLQTACIDLYRTLMKYNLAVCWLHVNTLWHSDTEKAPKKPCFSNFTCSNTNSHCKFDYQKNVTILMKHVK